MCQTDALQSVSGRPLAKVPQFFLQFRLNQMLFLAIPKYLLNEGERSAGRLKKEEVQHPLSPCYLRHVAVWIHTT